MDVRIDGESRLAKGLNHDDASRLVADAGQPLERLDVARNLPAMFFDQHLREPLEIARLARRKAATADQLQELVLGEGRELLWSGRSPEERRRDPIHLGVSGLR